MRYRIDPETLREVPDDPEGLTAWLARQRPTTHAEWTAVGQAARLLDRLDEAERAFRRADDTPATRLRLAQVRQWQGRFAEADEACAELLDHPVFGHFAHQHAGKSRYEQGDWRAAERHFRIALDLREDPELRSSSELALDAANACATAAEVAVELHRLIPPVHRQGARYLHGERPPHTPVLADLASVLAHGPMPLRAVRDVHRYHPRLEAALADTDWLVVADGQVTATERCRAFLVVVNEAHTRAAADLWPVVPDITVPRVDHPMSVARTGETPQARLFDQLRALRQHRGDAHAAAWAEAGLEVRELPEDDPVRRRIEVATDRAAARPYRALTRDGRAELLSALRRL
ncbi:hypothetical protein LZG04_18640 [Saccharothrix sp. S26]|uniref:hypothetical protein n=1 Tax=Saccharothrix sp. S26 TaxID=2907215 RepID=UPI001F4423CB|nr:hypothetical protein [Saccharothrix sp. S26]MCE6996807.1 hypothetical protein [Saccharothrix sp. S26]